LRAGLQWEELMELALAIFAFILVVVIFPTQLLLRWLFSTQSNPMRRLDLFAAAPFWLLCELMNGVVAGVFVGWLLAQLRLELVS
jgi:hypothetical protein